MRWRAPLFLVLLLLVCFGFASRAETLGLPYHRALKLELNFLIAQRPGYLWGGASDPKQGLDCSGYITLAALRAGMPVRRTTARRMASGDAGWIGADVPRGAAVDLDLVFWTFHDRRPEGHVGAFYGGSLKVTHSSSTRGVVVEPMTDYLERTLSRVRRLTIGD